MSLNAEAGLDLVFDLAGRIPATAARGSRTSIIRATSFVVAWTETDGPDADPLRVEADQEYMVLLPDCPAVIEHEGTTIQARSRSICIVPAGRSAVHALAAGRLVRLFAPASTPWADAELPAALRHPPAVRPVVPAFRRRDPHTSVRIHALDLLPNSPGMPRARQVQSATISVGWVEYEGPRVRSQLSPHSHVDFEQGSLALEGEFVQHLRAPWGPDADRWLQDRHIHCGPGSLTLIPPPVIHTTEGVGEGRHILIDIFAPPRRDFIAKGQVLNAADYIDPATEPNSPR